LTISSLPLIISGSALTCAACAQREYRHHEKNVSTQQDQARTHARVSRALCHPWWSSRPGSASSQGQGSSERLSRPAVRQPNSAQTVVDSPSSVPGDGQNTFNKGRNNGFPRDARLLDGTAFSSVFKRNRRIANDHFTVLVHRRSANSGARLGLAIAKKRAKRAVDRNRIKRVTRESFRHQRSQLQGLDLVVMNRDAAATASAASLRSSLDALWPKVIKAGRSGSHSAVDQSDVSASLPFLPDLLQLC